MNIKERLIELHKAQIAEIEYYKRKEISSRANQDRMVLYYTAMADAHDEFAKEISLLICGIDKGYLQ